MIIKIHNKASLIYVIFRVELNFQLSTLIQFCCGHSIKLLGYRFLKNFNIQTLLQDLAEVDWDRISLTPTVNDAWNLFRD